MSSKFNILLVRDSQVAQSIAAALELSDIDTHPAQFMAELDSIYETMERSPEEYEELSALNTRSKRQIAIKEYCQRESTPAKTLVFQVTDEDINPTRPEPHSRFPWYQRLIDSYEVPTVLYFLSAYVIVAPSPDEVIVVRAPGGTEESNDDLAAKIKAAMVNPDSPSFV